MCGVFMELAGLEPAPSWVRSRRSSEREMACLQPVSGECLECPNISRNILIGVLQWDNGCPASPGTPCVACASSRHLVTSRAWDRLLSDAEAGARSENRNELQCS